MRIVSRTECDSVAYSVRQFRTQYDGIAHSIRQFRARDSFAHSMRQFRELHATKAMFHTVVTSMLWPAKRATTKILEWAPQKPTQEYVYLHEMQYRNTTASGVDC